MGTSSITVSAKLFQSLMSLDRSLQGVLALPVGKGGGVRHNQIWMDGGQTGWWVSRQACVCARMVQLTGQCAHNSEQQKTARFPGVLTWVGKLFQQAEQIGPHTD